MMAYENCSYYLDGLLNEWDMARRPQELTMLECYQDFMRIAREGDTKGTGVAKTQTSKPLFMGVTRSKIRSATAKVNDSLFGNGEMPFDISATNPELEPFSDTFEVIINGQLEAMDFRDILSAGTVAEATYGTSFTFGPFVRKAKKKHTKLENNYGTPMMVEAVHEYDEPYYELGNTLDVYPDPAARTMKEAQGLFWVSMFTPSQVLALEGEGYKNAQEAARMPDSAGIETGSDRAQSMRANIDYWYKDGRIKFARYFGKIPASKVEQLEADVSGDEGSAPVAKYGDSEEMISVVVIMAGGYVLKVTRVDDSERSMVLRTCWENALDEMWGVGVAENNFSMQRVTNAAFRMYTESKGLALNPTKAVDRSKFLPSEDFKQYPGKVYQFKSGLTPDEKNSAIIPIMTPDVSTGWMDLINMAGQFSDDDTGITKYTQGDDSSHLNKTASGISMIMSASSLPLKEVIEHKDTTIEAIIEGLIDWNLMFMKPETVAILYGQEHAQRWAQILRFGKASFLDFKATGTSSFMAKEVLTSKLQAFMSLAMGNPVTAQLVNAEELLGQVWDAMEVGRKSPIKSAQDNGGMSPEIQQQIQASQDQIKQMDEAIQKLTQELESKQATELLAQQKAANEAMKLENDRYQKETDRLQLEYEREKEAKNDLTESEKVQFEADFQQQRDDAERDHQVEMAILNAKLNVGIPPNPLEQKAATESLMDGDEESSQGAMLVRDDNGNVVSVNGRPVLRDAEGNIIGLA